MNQLADDGFLPNQILNKCREEFADKMLRLGDVFNAMFRTRRPDLDVVTEMIDEAVSSNGIGM